VGLIVKRQTHSYPVAGRTLEIEVLCSITIQNVACTYKRDTFSCLKKSHKILRNNKLKYSFPVANKLFKTTVIFRYNTSYMQQNPFCVDDLSIASQETRLVLWESKDHYGQILYCPSTGLNYINCRVIKTH